MFVRGFFQNDYKLNHIFNKLHRSIIHLSNRVVIMSESENKSCNFTRLFCQKLSIEIYWNLSNLAVKHKRRNVII